MVIIRDLAAPLPIIVIAELLGIPSENRDRFKRWSDTLIASTSASVLLLPGWRPELLWLPCWNGSPVSGVCLALSLSCMKVASSPA